MVVGALTSGIVMELEVALPGMATPKPWPSGATVIQPEMSTGATVGPAAREPVGAAEVRTAGVLTDVVEVLAPVAAGGVVAVPDEQAATRMAADSTNTERRI